MKWILLGRPSMPWREVSVMDQRREFVRLAAQEGANRRELCRRFGISPDIGYKWLRLAADQGNAGAKTNVAWMYQNGLGVPKDQAGALNWYQKAADQDWAVAQFNLAWTISDAGRRIRGAITQAAGIRNPSQNRTSTLESEAICLTSIELCERDQLSVPPNDLRPPFRVHLGYHIPKARQDRAC
jgi:TPR repeat protein